jgi:hypothetical protein
MKSYQILNNTSYSSIVISRLLRNNIALTETLNFLHEISKKEVTGNDLNKDFTMVKQNGLTNLRTGKNIRKVQPYA